MPGRIPPWIRLVILISAVGIFGIGYYWGNRYQYGSGEPRIHGVLIRPPAPLPPVRLRDSAGRTFTEANFQDQWTLLAFGSLAEARGQRAATRLMEIRTRLGESGDRLQPVLIARRQPPEMALAFQRFGPFLQLLSGEGDPLESLAAFLGESLGDSGASQATIYLIGPQGRLRALFPPQQPTETLIEDLKVLLKRS